MWKVEEWCSTHQKMVKGGMDDFRRMWDAKPASYLRKKTDNAKQWGVLEKCILSVQAAEKYVDCFYDLVGIYVVLGRGSMVRYSVIQRYLQDMQPNICVTQAIHYCRLGTWACATARCNLLAVKAVNLPVPQNTQGNVWSKRFWLLLRACHAAGRVQHGAAISRNRWINTDL